MAEIAADACDDAPVGTSELPGSAKREAAFASRLQRAEAALQLSAGVGHDVRNALQVVLGHSELLCYDTLNDRQTEAVRAIHHAASHAVAVLGDLMVLARATESPVEVINCAMLLEKMRPMLRQVARSRVECVFKVDPPVWPVAVEPHQLEAVLINLCANARDAMPDGGQLEVTVRNVVGSPELANQAAADHVVFAVRDTGTGMTREVLERAAEAFYTTKADGGGTGLGLAMAQEFAVRAGGELRIESALGHGTTVELRLPRATEPATLDADLVHRRTVVLQALHQRVRTPWMCDVLDAWRRACGSEALPRPFDIDVAIAEHADMSLVVLADSDAPTGRLRLQRIGRALQDALDAVTRGEGDVTAALVGALGDVYRRVFESQLPSYEHAHYAFGDGPPADFERLVMPASADGRRVSHIIGVVSFTGAGSR